MVMVEQFADSTACAFGDVACAFGGANTDVLAGYACTFADIACSVERVKRDEIFRAFANTLGCCSSALGCAFADIF